MEAHHISPYAAQRGWRERFLERAERRSRIGETPLERRAMVMTQLAVFIALSGNILILLAFSLLISPTPWVLVAVLLGSSTLYGVCLLPLRSGRERIGRFLFSAALISPVTPLSLSMGRAAGAHALYVPLAMGGAIIWPRSARGQVLMGAICAVLLLIVHLSAPFHGLAGVTFRDATLDQMSVFHVILTTLLSGVVVYLNSGSTIQLQEMLDSERRHAESLVYHVLPRQVANELMDRGDYTPRIMDEVSVVFADIVGFTSIMEDHPPEIILDLLNELFSRFDQLAERHHTEKIKTIGDAYMVVAGAPTARADHLEVSAALAFDMLRAASEFQLPDRSPLRIRIGMDTGPVMAGIVGENRYIYDVWGTTVNTASRMESHGEAGKIQVTRRVYDGLSDSHILISRGETLVKGLGIVETWWLKPNDG